MADGFWAWAGLARMPQSLDEPASRHFTWRSLVECGPYSRLTGEGLAIAGPQEIESWRMLAGLSQVILDQVVDSFGPVELTYAFSGPSMFKHLKGRITTPHLDQHAAAELNQRRHPVCSRGGAAADFKVPGRSSRELADWIIAELPFDRLYFYGPRRSVHVSWNAQPMGQAWAMVKGPSGRRLPRPYSGGKGKT